MTSKPDEEPRDEAVYRIELPEHLRDRPEKAFEYDFPTAWLLGTQLLTSLRDIAMSAIFEFDPRDWMTAGDRPIDLTSIVVRDDAPDASPDAKACWIDFLADSGDSPRLVYQLAYLLQQEQLQVLVPRGKNDRTDKQLAFPDGSPRLLPRGKALVFGGDTAYPIATRRRLLERVRAPFVWAFKELYPLPAQMPPDVHLLGVPGNHDYYNELYGFERVFHAGSIDPKAKPEDRVDLPGYKPRQQASYFAAQLPMQWQIWGLDVERTVIDARQRDYFQKISSEQPASNLIVVTSKPTFVYHALSEHEKDLAESFRRIDLPRAFEQDGQLSSDRVRLDLSGDTHLYERYWGTDLECDSAPLAGEEPHLVADESPGAVRRREAHRRAYRAPDTWGDEELIPKRGNETEKQEVTPERTNYASVVSGLGGAFHHPSQLRFGKAAPRKAWPTSDESTRAVGAQLIRPRKVFQAGAIGVVGLLLGAWTFCMLWRASTQVELDVHVVKQHIEVTRISRSILDLPFELPHCPAVLHTGLRNLWLMGSFLLTLAAIIGVIAVGVWWGKRLAKPIKDMQEPSGWWGRLSHGLSHNRLAFAALRFVGGNRRNAWAVIATAPAWILTLAICSGLIVALAECPHLFRARDGFGALYVWLTLLALGMCALGAGLAGKRFRLRRRNEVVTDAAKREPDVERGKERFGPLYYVKAVAGRFAFGILGLVVGLLIIWTPYAWLRLFTAQHHRYWALVFFVYPVIRRLVFGGKFLSASARTRHVFTAIAFLFISGLYCLTPILALSPAELQEPLNPYWGFPLAAFFGAYMACLWLGWYFFVCLQFDAHGNEAGAAARVVAYAQFMRIKLTPTAAEVWTIAAEDPPIEPDDAGGLVKLWRRLAKPTPFERQPRARIVDHFIVGKP